MFYSLMLRREEGRSAGYIQDEWSRGCRPRATTDFPAIVYNRGNSNILVKRFFYSYSPPFSI
jgi:hypothetical protein